VKQLAAQAGVQAPEISSRAEEYSNWSHFDTSKPLPYGAKWKPEVENTKQCMLPLLGLQVLVDGTVSFCGCADFDGNTALVLGKIGDKTIKEMVESRKYHELWNWSRHGVPDFCKHCSFHSPMESAHALTPMFEYPPQILGG